MGVDPSCAQYIKVTRVHVLGDEDVQMSGHKLVQSWKVVRRGGFTKRGRRSGVRCHVQSVFRSKSMDSRMGTHDSDWMEIGAVISKPNHNGDVAAVGGGVDWCISILQASHVVGEGYEDA